MRNICLFDNGEHKYYLLGWEESEEEGLVQTNQYLIIHNRKGFLIDPGGAHVFPRVLANVSEVISPDDIEGIFYSHQDPDVSSGITMWLTIASKAKIYISELWTRFLPHFGVFDKKRVVGLKDAGEKGVRFSGYVLDFLPAHFLHSPGHFNVYDPISKILFSGDIGVAVFSFKERMQIIETDFEKYKVYMEGFHKRYMSSNSACKAWVEKVQSYDIDAIAPQHGAVMKGKVVREFLNWFKGLKCGVDLINEFYGR
ncbi:beta-lactamase [Thermosipho melanesiensis]|uniref:Beta-lactamase domain protein n=2 Tax=Thermosipho melanesiensis TaxID=46541 RepID=A6LP51_THEM4|nr:MBL fold metallo-hydrolase [Thermosipho melanesiensis]ABR31702.1 beta-lactamase domain protein [Thermosipho melanesiensis BI429]APT74725.1 beta-lactamase [Thermosipho melanesiensis]OOC35226.1 beta-lactamase [Thermosipho melanesiensis]OOC35436.1 beta-lactamase [Thermosipho melanesiensis]OOC36687.1 beta-lactamase [Thermosipho melanesiensis]